MNKSNHYWTSIEETLVIDYQSSNNPIKKNQLGCLCSNFTKLATFDDWNELMDTQK